MSYIAHSFSIDEDVPRHKGAHLQRKQSTRVWGRVWLRKELSLRLRKIKIVSHPVQHQGEVHQVPPGLTIHNRILYIFVNYQSDDLSKGGIISRVALSVLWAWKLKTWNTSFPAFSNIFALAQQTPSFKKLEYFPSPNNPPLLILKLFFAELTRAPQRPYALVWAGMSWSLVRIIYIYIY